MQNTVRQQGALAGSGGFGCDDDDSCMLGQRHLRVKQTHHPVFHNSGDGHGAPVANMLLERTRLFAWRYVGVGQVRLGRKLVVQSLAALGPQVGLGGRHGDSLSSAESP